MPAPAVRVSVIGTRRADLVLPGAVPVAELLPALAGEVLEPEERYAGCRVLLPDGRVLSPGEGVVAQGVRDGAVLSLVAGVEPPPLPSYDDAAEAVAEAAADVPAWTPGAGTALAAAGVAGLVAALAAATRIAGSHAAIVLDVVLVAAAVAPPVWGVLALTSTPIGSHRWDEQVDPRGMAADAAGAQRRLRMLLTGSGALVVAIAPVAAASGRWGAALAVSACLLPALRTRRQRGATETLVGLGATGLGLLATAVTVVVAHAVVRTPVALAAAAIALVVACGRRRPEAATLWWGRPGDVLETVAVLTLLPFLALAAGLVPGVRP